MKKKEIILDTVSDLVTDFLEYDRKEDEDLLMGDIEKAIEMKIISVDEIVKHFKKELVVNLNPLNPIMSVGDH